jgi:hypothetical protein
MQYGIKSEKGRFSKPANGAILRIHPQANTITVNLAAN